MSTDDRVAKLEEQITTLHDQQADLRKQQADLRKQLAKAQLDQWQGRFEAMEVQMRLGTVKATDKATALMDQLARKWADARKQFEESVSTASGVADTVRTGLENAYAELRKALLESRSQLESKNKPT